jgi:integrase
MDKQFHDSWVSLGSSKGRNSVRRNRVNWVLMTLYVARRETKKGVRWHARFQHSRVNGGKVVHLGVYDSEKGAKLRLKAAKQEMERTGRAPSRFIEDETPAPESTISQRAVEWLATREHDAADSTVKGYRHSLSILPAWLGALDPHAVTRQDVQRFVTELARVYKRGTLSKELGVLRQVLDFADVRPNPCQDRQVRLPRSQRRDYRLPTRAQLVEMHEAMPSRIELMVLLEHTGLRIEEAAALRWADFDRKRDRLLVREGKTTAARRWVTHLEDTPPFPVKPRSADSGSLVFAKPSASSLTGILRVSHLRHGTFLMSSHEFRHLHASRLLHEGPLSPAQIAARLGHANTAVLHSTYAHVIPPED